MEAELPNQIKNHDSKKWDNLVDLNRDEMKSPVIMNKDVNEADLAVLMCHVLGNPWGI